MPLYPNLAGLRPEGVAAYTPATAAWVDGRHTSIGYLRMEPGTWSVPHYHHDEQFLYILKGTLRAAVEGEILDASPGDLLHFPPGAVHEVLALEEPVEFVLSRSPARGDLKEGVIHATGEKARSLLRA